MKSLFILGAPLALAACTPAPELLPSATLAPAVSSTTQIGTVKSSALLVGYTARPVTGPSDWRQSNDQQSPTHKEDN